ncbi:hypothetical protein C8Q80DRAFT_545920 [Daedaleopsis nitida]|nr:hypothetical protein C8Q80DRAFT_545920 [Daedaleopsis nitida]
MSSGRPAAEDLSAPRCMWPNIPANHTSDPADPARPSGTSRAHGTDGPDGPPKPNSRRSGFAPTESGEIGARFGSGRNRGLSKLSVASNSVAVRPTCQCVPRAVHSTDKAQMGQARAIVQGTFKGPQKASVHPDTEEI